MSVQIEEITIKIPCKIRSVTANIGVTHGDHAFFVLMSSNFTHPSYLLLDVFKLPNYLGYGKNTILIKDKLFRLRENHQNMCFVGSKEPSHRDISLEHPKHKFWLREIKIIVHNIMI